MDILEQISMAKIEIFFLVSVLVNAFNSSFLMLPRNHSREK